MERNEETELNGVGEERDEMSGEEGDEIDGEEELAAPGWRVRAGTKANRHRRREKSTKQHTYRDWCAHCMMGKGRTHYHVCKTKSEEESRKSIIAMDYYLMKMESAPNVQAISEESVACVAVKEDRHQNIMSSVVLKKRIEEPRASERVARSLISLGYREITLNSEIEPAIIAFRTRVAEMCKAEVTTEDAVKGDKESNGLIENAVMLHVESSEPPSVTLRAARKNH